jgi:hypothetical protein
MTSNPGPIMQGALKTRRHLRDLISQITTKLELGKISSGVEADAEYLTDCLDRFNIWTRSLGVFQQGEASLDARLSNHYLAREVLRLLKQLNVFTSDCKHIIII